MYGLPLYDKHLKERDKQSEKKRYLETNFKRTRMTTSISSEAFEKKKQKAKE